MGLIGLIIGGAAVFVLNSKNIGASEGKKVPAAVADAPSPVPTPKPTPAPAEEPPAGPVPPVDLKNDHIRGNPKATVAVIEYSDFECPFCVRAEPTMRQISKDYGDKVMVVYRHYPLSLHKNAQKQAEATECANDQGKFWEYHDAIFDRSTNGTVTITNLVPLAKELGLNETTFKNCLDTNKYAQDVQDEMAAGAAAGVRGTPGTFVVNMKTQKSTFISGAQPFNAFKTAIDAMLTNDK